MHLQHSGHGLGIFQTWYFQQCKCIYTSNSMASSSGFIGLKGVSRDGPGGSQESVPGVSAFQDAPTHQSSARGWTLMSMWTFLSILGVFDPRGIGTKGLNIMTLSRTSLQLSGWYLHLLWRPLPQWGRLASSAKVDLPRWNADRLAFGLIKSCCKRAKDSKCLLPPTQKELPPSEPFFWAVYPKFETQWNLCSALLAGFLSGTECWQQISEVTVWLFPRIYQNRRPDLSTVVSTSETKHWNLCCRLQRRIFKCAEDQR